MIHFFKKLVRTLSFVPLICASLFTHTQVTFDLNNGCVKSANINVDNGFRSCYMDYFTTSLISSSGYSFDSNITFYSLYTSSDVFTLNTNYTYDFSNLKTYCSFEKLYSSYSGMICPFATIFFNSTGQNPFDEDTTGSYYGGANVFGIFHLIGTTYYCDWAIGFNSLSNVNISYQPDYSYYVNIKSSYDYYLLSLYQSSTTRVFKTSIYTFFCYDYLSDNWSQDDVDTLSELQSNYETLNTEYASLLTEYNNIKVNYDAIQSVYSYVNPNDACNLSSVVSNVRVISSTTSSSGSSFSTTSYSISQFLNIVGSWASMNLASLIPSSYTLDGNGLEGTKSSGVYKIVGIDFYSTSNNIVIPMNTSFEISGAISASRSLTFGFGSSLSSSYDSQSNDLFVKIVNDSLGLSVDKNITSCKVLSLRGYKGIDTGVFNALSCTNFGLSASSYQTGYQVGYTQGVNNTSKGYQDEIDSLNQSISDLEKEVTSLTNENSSLNDTISGLSNGEYTFSSLFWGISQTPFGLINSIFDVDVLGINIGALITGLFSAMLLIWLVRKLI
jgi:hypothetical protein